MSRQYGIMMGNHTFLVFRNRDDALAGVRGLTGDQAHCGEMAFVHREPGSPVLHRKAGEPDADWLARVHHFYANTPDREAIRACWLGLGGHPQGRAVGVEGVGG